MSALTAARVSASASATVQDEFEGAEPFDAWVPTAQEVYESDLPLCAFERNVPESVHVWEDTVRQWMECVGCGRVEVRDDWK